MKLYASLKDIPELNGLTEDERLTVHRVCASRALRSGGLFKAGFLAGCCGGMGAGLGCFIAYVGWSPLVLWILLLCSVTGAAAGGAVGGFISWQITAHYLRPFYSDYIRTKMERG
jgi:hypothetical protein